MKKLLSLLLFIAVTMPAWALEFSVGDYAYKTQGDNSDQLYCTGFSTTGAAQSSVAVKIPYMVTYNGKTYYVESISANAFLNKTNIASVNITYGVKRIGASSFAGCSNMTYLRMPSSITDMYSTCFANCDKLETVYWASTTGSLYNCTSDCFSSSTSRKLYVNWNAAYDNIKKAAFYHSGAFKTMAHSSYAYDIYMSDGTMAVVTKASTSTSEDHECTIIGFNKYGGDAGVSSGIYKPSSYHTKPIGQDRYFKYTRVATLAFSENEALTQLDLVNLTAINSFDDEFAELCPNLTYVRLASGLVGYKAFQGNKALTNVVLDGVKTINDLAFYNCTALTSINIPESVTSIGTTFVHGCSALEKITVAANNPKYSSDGYCLFDKNKTYLVRLPEGYTSYKYTTPFSLVGIYSNAFYNLGIAKEIFINYGCETIGSYAFVGSKNLRRIDIPSSVSDMGVGLFNGCTGLTDLYVNCDTMPAINKSLLFDGAANPNLYVQRKNCGTTYLESLGWTSFKSVNYDGVCAADYYYLNNGYTVSSTKPVTISGVSFTGGTCRVVRGYLHNNVSGDVFIPVGLTLAGKTFAVTEIENYAFDTKNTFNVTGCKLVRSVGSGAFEGQPITSIVLPAVDEIGNNAFDGCTSLTSVTWGSNLRIIYGNAFRNTAITGDIILPYGFTALYGNAFYGVKSKKILIPSSTTTLNAKAFTGMSSLTELIINQGYFQNQTFDFTGVPTSCYVRVPVAWQEYAKVHSDWKRFTNIYAGAYDFCQGGPSKMTSNLYKMTVTSNTPVSKDGVTYYDGTAKYVYNAQMSRGTAFYANMYETDEMLGGNKKYLITEIGDSCLNGSAVETVSLDGATYLERIGKKAFGGTTIRSITVPENCTKFGKEAFSNATSLKELTIMGDKSHSWDGQFVGNNASDFTMYINFYSVRGYLTSNLKDWVFSGTTNMVKDHVAPYIKATGTTQQLGQLMPLDFASSGVKAYVVTGYNSTETANTKEVTAVPANTGVIVTGLTEGNIYKIKRAPASTTYYGSNYLVSTADASVDIHSIDGGYYWDRAQTKFVKPTSLFNSGVGRSYLKLPAGLPSEYYLDIFKPAGVKGDVDGNGVVDITDVNIIINIVLGNDSASNYGGRADVTEDGTVDVSDINAVLNIILGT